MTDPIPDPEVTMISDAEDAAAAEVEQPAEQPHPLAGTPEFDSLMAQIEQNKVRQQTLAMQGIVLKDDDLLSHRLELLIEFLLPSEELRRIEFEQQWSDQITRSLDAAERQVARMRLTAPGAVPPASAAPGLIVPGGAGRRS